MVDTRLGAEFIIADQAAEAQSRLGGEYALVDQAAQTDELLGGIYCLADQAATAQSRLGAIFILVDAELTTVYMEALQPLQLPYPEKIIATPTSAPQSSEVE